MKSLDTTSLGSPRLPSIKFCETTETREVVPDLSNEHAVEGVDGDGGRNTIVGHEQIAEISGFNI
jgi:hypothetical protein